MHGGGSRGGGSMGHGGFSSSGFHGGSGMSAAPHFGQSSGQSFGTGFRHPAFHSGSPVGTFRGPAFGNRRFRNRVFFSSVYPGSFGYYGYPGFYSGDFYSTADSYPAYDYDGSNYYDSSQNQVAQQQEDIDRLEDEVARLRAQRESHEASASQAENNSELPTPTLLIFRDKHTQEVQNYAVVGGTLWIFGEQRATKFPLSSLDVDATTKANDERGVDFQVPR
jgi:hypothetical protein